MRICLLKCDYHLPNYPFAPRETFEEILKFMPIPTFDLILYHPDKSVVVVKRTIDPYKNVWALPGLRMFKTESINDTLKKELLNKKLALISIPKPNGSLTSMLANLKPNITGKIFLPAMQ